MSNLKKQFKLVKLIEEILQEVGDLRNVKPYPFTHNLHYYTGSFITENGDLVSMSVQDISNQLDRKLIPPSFIKKVLGLVRTNIFEGSIFQIAYEVEGSSTQYRKVEYGELVRILKTLVDFLNIVLDQVIKDHGRDTIFVIGSQAKDTADYKPDPQKDALYRSILLKNLPKDFRSAEINVEGKPGLIFQKK